MRNEFTAIVEQDHGWYVTYCLEVPGANGQGDSMEACKRNLVDAITLILEEQREEAFRKMPINARREIIVVD